MLTAVADPGGSERRIMRGTAVADPGGSDRKTCFVAMPVTTPAPYADDLRDPDHFAHVLTHLFTPALEQAGYTAIPPKALGAALIHAEIIRNLEQADLVLADLSSHNANVFFELGIRTSLDRPVVLVKDARTATIPFDLGTINVLTYDESLAPWKLGEEIRRLAEHVSSVTADGGSGNAMWTYFGLTKRGGPAEAGDLGSKVDLMLAELTKLRLASPPVPEAAGAGSYESRYRRFLDAVEEYAVYVGADEPPDVATHKSGQISVVVMSLGSDSVEGWRQQIVRLAERERLPVSNVSGPRPRARPGARQVGPRPQPVGPRPGGPRPGSYPADSSGK